MRDRLAGEHAARRGQRADDEQRRRDEDRRRQERARDEHAAGDGRGEERVQVAVLLRAGDRRRHAADREVRHGERQEEAEHLAR